MAKESLIQQKRINMANRTQSVMQALSTISTIYDIGVISEGAGSSDHLHPTILISMNIEDAERLVRLLNEDREED
jgi:hypothetical protein